MLFFSNPRRGKRAKNRRRASVRRKSRRRARVRSTGGNMARRGKRRASSRRRRRSRSKVTQVALRRRGVTVYRSNPRRRRRGGFRRNPSFGGSGIVATLKQGVKDGAVVLASQVAARKAINVVSALNPIKGIPGAAITGLGVPVILTIAARKLLPSQARLVSAAAFAEGMRGLLAATPVGPFLSDYTAGGGLLMDSDAVDGLDAWPGVPQLGAYPTLGGEDDMSMYVQ